MAGDVVRIKTGVRMPAIPGSTLENTLEIPRTEWDALTPEQREERLADIAQETLADEVIAWAYVDVED
jgi:hypothetical protein